jgi:hypothetical protein
MTQDEKAPKDRLLDTYVLEYQQCCDSYRHTYTTIWAAGGLFGAASGAILALSSRGGDIDPVIQVIAPLPMLFWYLGIFRPMNRYGEWRSTRAGQIEDILMDHVDGLVMQHYRHFESARKRESRLYRLITFKWIWRPRVVEVVSIAGAMLIAAEIALIWVNFL